MTRSLRTLLLAALVALAAPAAGLAQDPPPTVAVVGTGGTIAGVSETRTSFITYRGGTIPVADLVGELRPEVEELADVRTEQFGNAGSGSYRIDDFRRLTLGSPPGST